jgi:hypothetical protein
MSHRDNPPDTCEVDAELKRADWPASGERPKARPRDRHASGRMRLWRPLLNNAIERNSTFILFDRDTVYDIESRDYRVLRARYGY